jgi:ribosomal protein S12 methylthiotransferase
MVSLGCDKNLVDSEFMLGRLSGGGYNLTNAPETADVIIVNTCGFIGEASREGIRTILEMAGYKKSGVCKALIVTGCMVTRYGDQIRQELPEVDAVLGTNELDHVEEVLERAMGSEAVTAAEPERQPARVLSTHGGYAFLKIAEGCDNHCTYCTIPSIKGPYHSRELEGLVAEAKDLAAQGVRELIIVAQDTTLYGTDIYGKPELHRLLRELSMVEGIAWLRILYAYPENITPELIAEMAANPKICRYIDMPIQHASDSVLKRMGRRSDEAGLRDTIGRLRAAIPGIALRTTLITGFPGETAEDFRILRDFVEETRFDRLGVFTYSREDGTPAYSLPGQVPERTKRSRRNEIMELQGRISKQINESFVGSTLDVLTEGRIPDEKEPGRFVYCGRSYRDSHDIDGLVFFHSPEEVISGSFVRVKISAASDYDLYGDIDTTAEATL